MRKDKIKLMATVMFMSVLMCMSSFADMKKVEQNGRTYLDIDGELHEMTIRNDQYGSEARIKGRYFEAPGWLWSAGNCYYFEKGSHQNWNSADSDAKYLRYDTARLFTNGITPDGYRVDEKGRWLDESGNPVRNNYGSIRLNMQDQYRGKSDDEIWEIMRNKLTEIFSTMYVNNMSKNLDGTERAIGCGVSKNSVIGNIGLYGPEMYAIHNYSNFDIKDASGFPTTGFVEIALPSVWNGSMDEEDAEGNVAQRAETPELLEKIIKTALGDNAGQELFDYIRNETESGKYNKDMIYTSWDENGEIVYEYILYKADGTAWETTEEAYEMEPSLEVPLEERMKFRIPDHLIGKARPELNGGVNSYDSVSIRPVSTRKQGMAFSAMGDLDYAAFQNKPTDYGKHYSIKSNKLQIF